MHHSNSTVRPACLVPMILFMLNSIHDINVGVIIVCACRNNHHHPGCDDTRRNSTTNPHQWSWVGDLGMAKCEKRRRLIQKSINKGSALNPHHVQSETNCSFNPRVCVDISTIFVGIAQISKIRLKS